MSLDQELLRQFAEAQKEIVARSAAVEANAAAQAHNAAQLGEHLKVMQTENTVLQQQLPALKSEAQGLRSEVQTLKNQLATVTEKTQGMGTWGTAALIGGGLLTAAGLAYGGKKLYDYITEPSPIVKTAAFADEFAKLAR